jgi:glycosyltransferase involved in cell wall biosynthesis
MNKQKKILVLCPYPQNCAPSQRLKFEQYYPHFEKEGFNVTVSPFVSQQFWKILYKKGFWLKKIIYTIYGYLIRFKDLFRIRSFDIIYVHLWVTPFGPPIFELLLSKLAKKIIYDIDDMVFLGHASEANKKFKPLKGTQKMIYLMKIANHVITCTPTLDQFVKQHNKNTTDISSTINTDVYIPKTNYELFSPVIIGWSGSHSTSTYLKILEPVFEKLLDYGINFKILIIGNKDFCFNNKTIPYEAIEWNLHTEVEDLKKIDIGVYPLPNESWVFGKSGLKALQYMALGIPTIATAIGANYRIIKHGENGFLIKDNNVEEWVKTLLQLINDKSLREKIGKKGIETVEKNFSVKANAVKYISVLKSL